MKNLIIILLSIILLSCNEGEGILGPSWHDNYEKFDGLILTDENGERYMLEYNYLSCQNGGHYEIKVERFHDVVNILGDSVIVKRFVYDYKDWH